jgi:preprotein translocase subunit SecD
MTKASPLATGVALLAAAAGCSGCRPDPVLRLTYEVDVAAAQDGDNDSARVVEEARKTISQRLDAMVGGRARVSARGGQVVVELAPLDAETLETVKRVMARSGRLEFDLIDEAATDKLFGALHEEALPRGEGIALNEERAPDGVDATGTKRWVRTRYARMACRPPSHAQESTGDCLGRFRGWAATLGVPADCLIAFEAVIELVPDTEPPRFEPIGWRTFLVRVPPELTNAAIADASSGEGKQNFDSYYVLVSFTRSGALRFEQFTRQNVNRRLAIVLDGIVDSAPVIQAAIGGGKATITMGAGDPEKQKRDAKQLELVLRSGALPAPVRLVSEERIGPRAR